MESRLTVAHTVLCSSRWFGDVITVDVVVAVAGRYMNTYSLIGIYLSSVLLIIDVGDNDEHSSEVCGEI